MAPQAAPRILWISEPPAPADAAAPIFPQHNRFGAELPRWISMARGGVRLLQHVPKADGIFTDADAVRFERLLPGPADRVWASLTESEKRRKWLARGRMELYAGGRVELHFQHAELSRRAEAVPEKYKHVENATLRGRVTRCEPPRALSFTWGDDAHPSEVAFTLAPHGQNVLLVLTHRRIARIDMASIAGGWHTHLGLLADHLDDFPAKPFWATHAKWEAEYARRLG
jgi:uncharacterized protein YndB with AHSA1/START domain